MIRRSVLVTALFVMGCGGDPEPPEPPNCDQSEWFPDADGDGFGDSAAEAVLECDAPDGHVDNADDCDDARGDVSPDGIEVCDDLDLDEDCSGAADDADPEVVGKVEAWPDVDLDGFGDLNAEPSVYCDIPTGWTVVQGDCDDAVAEVNPDADEVCDENDVDEDCSGAADNDDPDALDKVEAWPDTDGDGFGDPNAASAFYCDVPVDWAADDTDCDDTAAGVNPGATEVCDPSDVDEDCSGAADDADPGVTGQTDTWDDVDGDGYGDDSVAAVPHCDVPAGRVSVPGDCDDAVAAVNPGATEVCDPNDIDEDCSGAADNADPAAVGKIDAWPDLDGDGFGNSSLPATPYCDVPGFMVPVDGDCDDSLAGAYPGAAFVEDPAACMVDSDGDGWGDPLPPASVTPGTDCGPNDSTVHPGAPDTSIDDIDQDCDILDGAFLVADDFELGSFDPVVWAANTGNVALTSAWSANGAWSLDVFGEGGVAETQPLDTTVCDLVFWTYTGMQGGDGSADAGDFLYLEYFDGTAWLMADTWEGGLNDDVWYPRGGTIGSAALRPDFKLRFRGDSSITGDHFYVDDLAIGCAFDGDDDGIPDTADCAPADPGHWSDCGLCVDSDNDAYGTDCDLGEDCNDANASIHPGASDPLDGIDTSCDGIDGAFVFDDFEAGAPNDWMWKTVQGTVSIETTWVGNGLNSLDIASNDSLVESSVVDTSSCTSVFWYYDGMKGGEGDPDAGEFLYLEYYDGAAWSLIDAFEGGGLMDVWGPRWGVLDAADARNPQFRVRFRSTASLSSEHWYVDDVQVGCSDYDIDGDGLPAPLDCDDTSADHWFDCGLCVDADGDARGTDCDLGADCDDGNASVYAGAPDPYDAVDTSCDGLDGRYIHDDFESGAPSVYTWQSVVGTATIESTWVASGGFSLDLADEDSVVESFPLDTSACTGITWHYTGLQGGEGDPDLGEFLHFEYFDGNTWLPLDAMEGGGPFDVWSQRKGVVNDPGALHPYFRVRFRSTASTSSEHFYVDDVYVACSDDDQDVDGYPPALDCDETSAAHWADCGACVDADGDDYGFACDLGPDCDDADTTVHPGASDPSGDGFDQDCDVLDGAALFFDDLETGGPDPALWASWGANVGTTSAWVAEGAYALDIVDEVDSTIESFPIDTSACPAVAWNYQGMIGGDGDADTGDFLHLEYFDGLVWQTADTWEGGADFDVWRTRSGIIADPAALSAGFKIRLRGESTLDDDHFYVDAIEVGCTGVDNDGDGLPNGLDCDDTNALHWSDCGQCTDADGDGRGTACDLGGDCNDADSMVFPGAPDPMDGIDTSCDGLDGEYIIDDFEGGAPDPFAWWNVEGDATIETTWVGNGAASLDLTDDTARVESAPIDTSSCSGVFWSYLGMKGGEGDPESSDFLHLEYFDGVAWVTVDTWAGGAPFDIWSLRSGVITDPAALLAGFRVRFRSDASTSSDHFYVDDVVVTCIDNDLDGDSLPPPIDCDDTDAAHWSDCGVCVDGDLDDYGAGCDLGGDCDDANASVNPGAADPIDGVDTTCDGLDGVFIADDFETGGTNPDMWTSSLGIVTPETTWVVAGTTSLDLAGTSSVESVAVDTSTCSGVFWSFLGMQGGEGDPDVGEPLVLEYFDGINWVPADAWNGGGPFDVWMQRGGVLDDPAALHPALRIRFSTRSSTDTEHFYIDDVLVGCTDTDGDGDGIPLPVDCDDTDGAHWFDCGLCADGDGDGYGVDCDLGADCNDSDATVFPSALDDTMDGVDQDCDAVDGFPLVFDDFELGGIDPAAWLFATGDVEPEILFVGHGRTSLDFFGDTGVIESVSVDSSACPTLTWSYLAMQGGEGSADSSDLLQLEWWDGAAWHPADSWEGGLGDDVWYARSGYIANPAAFHAGFAVRVRGLSNSTLDHFYVDDVAVGCGTPDADADGVPDSFDCAPNDAMHWSDCGLCVDADLDGFGLDCDLGEDCDDADLLVHPGVADPLDTFDLDCDSLDEAVLVETFDGGAPNISAFGGAYAQVDPGPDGACVAGSYRPCGSLLHLDGTSDATTVSFDVSHCATVGWSFWGFRGPDTPENGNDLYIEWDTGGGVWTQAHLWGGGASDPDWIFHSGTITDPAAISPTLRLRFRTDGQIGDDYSLDDLRIGCFN